MRLLPATRAGRAAGAALLSLACAAAYAQVSLQGVLGSKALLIINGADPKMLATGETFQGVKLLSTSGDRAVVEFQGEQHALRVGESPARVGGSGDRSSSGGGLIVLQAASGGHFMAEGRINSAAVRFMVDTGATTIALSEADAKRVGVDYKGARMGYSATANGGVPTWQVRLASVRIGDVEVHDVDAVVLPTAMPFVLLGNSFLNRFRMRRDNDVMVLERRY